MDDGCSLCSPAVMHMVRETFKLKETPTSVQGRLGGAKGIWTIDPSAEWDSDDIWIRINESQLKYEPHEEDEDDTSPNGADWARWTLDVLAYSKEPEPTTMNHQFVQIMEMQGVPFEPFKELLEEHLDEEFKEIWNALERSDALRSWLWDHAGVGSDRITHSGNIYMEGRVPVGYAEQAIMLMEAGFTPKGCHYMMERIRNIGRNSSVFLQLLFLILTCHSVGAL